MARSRRRHWKSRQRMFKLSEGMKPSVCGATYAKAAPSAPMANWSHINLGGLAGHRYLILTDALWKWPEVVEMKSATAAQVTEVLHLVFAHYSLPCQRVLGNGPQFILGEFQEFCVQNRIRHIGGGAVSCIFKWSSWEVSSIIQIT